jgi:hypothetical protein
MSNTKAKNTICLWFNKGALDAARFKSSAKAQFLCHLAWPAVFPAPTGLRPKAQGWRARAYLG